MDDIWDDDAEQVTRPNTTRGFSSRSRMLSDSEEDRPSKRARTSNKPLFNPGSDDEAEKEAELPPDVGALFEGLDDDDYALEQLPAQLDTDQLRREADKRVAVEAAKKRMMRGDVLGDLADGAPGEKGKEKEPKAKKVIPKLDEQRLLDRDGLPALIRRTKDFNIKGKGHELGDLNRLMQTYQLWAHKMFPKMQFQDTVERVERLCRTKRMHVALSTWRDIDRAPGIPDVDIDDEAENQEQTDRDRAEAHPPTSSPARITLEPGGPPVRQSQADRDLDEDEDAMWRDMMDAMEMQQLEKEKQNQASGGRKESNDLGDDEEDWAAMDEMEQAVNSIKPSHDVGSKSVHPDVPSSPPGTDHDVSSDAPPELGPSEDEEDFYSMYEP